MPQLPQPKLPEPAHPDVDSMLSRKFGKEVANYFSGVYALDVPPVKVESRHLIIVYKAPH